MFLEQLLQDSESRWAGRVVNQPSDSAISIVFLASSELGGGDFRNSVTSGIGHTAKEIRVLHVLD